jgi:hypothetical protein
VRITFVHQDSVTGARTTSAAPDRLEANVKGKNCQSEP